jgi:hypothetical protein
MSGAAASVLRARVPGNTDTRHARTALERWLAAIDLPRLGLPDDAIVIVRQLRGSFAALDDRQRDPLALALRAAVRPAQHDMVGVGVGVVWFADEAELLACLARDALRGALAARWWWPVLFGHAATLPLALRRWVAGARTVPRALQQLGEQAQDEAWLALIGADGRTELTAALARAYPLCDAVCRCVAEADASPAPAKPAEPAPRATWLPPAMPTGAQLLMRLAEVLLREPQRAADAALVVALRMPAVPLGPLPTMPPMAPGPAPLLQADARTGLSPTQDVASCAALHGGRPDATPMDGPNDRARSHLADLASGAPRATGEGAPPDIDGPSLASQRRHAPKPVPPPDAWRAPAHPAHQSGLQGVLPSARGEEAARAPSQPGVPQHGVPTAEDLRHDRDAHAAAASARLPAAREPIARPRRSEVAAGLPASFSTNFGGLCFLLNVAIAFDWYGDFTQPQHRSLPVSPWWLLLAAGRAGFGRAFANDPLAQWLAAHAGAQHSPDLPDDRPPWRLSEAALRPFVADARPWHAVVTPDAVRLWHPAGFVVAQGPAGTPAQALLEALRRPQQALEHHASARTARRATSLTALLWPALSARLALALGLPAAQPAVALALALPARAHARAERLDLHFSLAALPLAVRLAGLDRDPGWLPAAGCDIRFHFD